MPIFRTKTKDGHRSGNFSYIDGLPGYQPGDAINATIDTDAQELLIKARAFKRPEIHLRLSQILDAVHTTDTELREEGKNVIGRAAVGALLLGPLGAIVGGMSGVGTKQKKESKDFILITYISSDNTEKTVVLEIVGASIGWNKFLADLPQSSRMDGEVYL